MLKKFFTNRSNKTLSNETELGEKIFSIGENDDDHKPHQLFCEMDELENGNCEWKEAARWLKFEEDVEFGGRWSKPHVATLSLHSLLELRSCLTNGAILLDFPGEDLNSIVDCLLENVIRLKYLDESKRDLVKNALLLRHVHQHEKEFQKQLNNGEKRTFPLIKSFADLSSKRSSHADMQNISNQPGNILATTNETNNNNNNNSASRPVFDLNESQVINKTDSKAKDLTAFNGSSKVSMSIASNLNRIDTNKINQQFMRKIPIGAEASNVLVGEVEFLETQFTALIRLSKSVVLGDFTEVPVPTRFLFIILGPKGNINKYHEIGRSISTLMSDEIFHEIAYKAKNRHEILIAFDGFLDQVTVLPPGEWDPNIRLKPPNKVPLKEERLEKIQAEINKLNGSINTSIKKEDEIHPHEDDPGLQFTGRFCGGLIDDIKRKAPWFISDFTDGLNFQCLSSILFMYFACLSPIITFGGLLGAATDQNMSAIESLVSGLVCGVLYGIFGGQPLTILGSTGPVLVFESILNIFAKENGIDYMGLRAWVGLWTAFILIVIVVTDCSALVKYITRFTEESFAALIALIFIIESVDKLIEIKKFKKFSSDPFNYISDYNNKTNCLRCVFTGAAGANKTISLNVSLDSLNQKQCNSLGSDFTFLKDCYYTPDVFFFSVFLYIFTFLLAMSIRFFKTSRFFPSSIRTKVADFGVVITIAIAVFVDWYFSFDTPKLIVPLKFETTIPTRGWFINPITRNPGKWWLCPLAIIPALLATILIFMDQHISCVIVNRKENKLKKGGGYHLDLLIVAITILINSLLGIPWFVAATVLSINHVLSLKKESEGSAPGEKPKFLGCIEQRLTNTVVFLMIGASVFLAKFLQLIPMPVLYGVFLYMGITSLNGIQFMHRIVIIFMPEKHQPDYIFLRHVRTFKVHMFTLIQIASIGMLFFVKSNKKISISFPLMVLALVGIRKLMDYIFTQKELSYLDDIMPELVKRSKEDGIENPDEINENNDELKTIKNESINISHELSKTNIWQDMVNNDKHTSGVKNRKINSHPVEESDVAIPLLITTSNNNNNNNNNIKIIPTFKISGEESLDDEK